MVNRKSENWEIHSNWLNEGKMMKLVGLFKGNKNINEGKCAKDIAESNDLNKSKKDNRSPVWIQKTKLEGREKLYSVYVATSHKGAVVTLDYAKRFDFNECFEDMENITFDDEGRFTTLFLYINSKVRSKTTKKKYTEDLKKLHNNKKGGYVKVPGVGTRRIRHQKNGKAYILLNGKKVKL